MFLVENVYGYTLTGGELRHFCALAFSRGRVVKTGGVQALRSSFPGQ
jgi:hypothetical protein